MNIRIPSKTFLLGEYAVLVGAPALMLCHEPFFEGAATGSEFFTPHPNSPTAKLSSKFYFRDPHWGRGGFGASGAEFITAFSLTEPQNKDFAQRAWKKFKALSGKGSGADILAQASSINRSSLFFLDLTTLSVEKIPSKLGLTISLFHTGKKLNTHEHLQQLPKIPVEKFKGLVIDAKQALLSGDSHLFVKSIREYGIELEKLGLLAAHSKEILKKFGTNVLAAKGCGAMGSDVVLVVHREELAGMGDMKAVATIHV